MTIVGWHASHEQIPPSELLVAARRGEEAGFDAGMSSDHFSPWSSRQGDSGFAWSWLGAAMATTSLPFGIVNAPGQRYHPADVEAQFVTPTDVRRRVLVSADPAWHCDRLAELVALGFDGLWIHHVGRAQLPFIDVFGEHVVPSLRNARIA